MGDKDPFAKIKGRISDRADKLEAEAAEDEEWFELQKKQWIAFLSI